MAKITRKNMKIFGTNATAQQRGVFGSLAAGVPAYSTDVETIQSLAQFESGWFAAVLGNNSPAIEDMNSLQYVFGYQLAYIFQQGIPEWNSLTTYYTNSLVMDANGAIFQSLTDTNLNNVTTDTTKWKPFMSASFRSVTTTATLALTDNVVLASASGGAYTITLPAAATATGKIYKIKKTDTTLNAITIDPNASELIDGYANVKLDIYNQTFEIVCNGTGWYII